MNIKTHKQPPGNDLFISQEVEEGGSLNTCSRPPQVLGFNGGEKKSILCLNRTWLSQCCFGNEDQEMGNLC